MKSYKGKIRHVILKDYIKILPTEYRRLRAEEALLK